MSHPLPYHAQWSAVHPSESASRSWLCAAVASLVGVLPKVVCVAAEQHYKELLSCLTTTSGPTKPSKYIHFISGPL